jgi:tRNA(Ile)-lysidine synthase
MLTEFLTFVNAHSLVGPGQRLLLAVSGGQDSVVLAELVHQAGFAFGIAHADFQLRGTDSEADAAFVEALARQYGVPFHTERFATRAYAEARGVSLQMAARTLRYAWLQTLQDEHAYDLLATGHHRTDSLETALLNLARGTGVAGLRGIPPRAGTRIRPLLFAARDALAAFAQQRGLSWREDGSNASDAYARNRLRHHVLPVLRELNPNLEGTFADTSERLSAAERLIRAEVGRVRELVSTPAGSGVALALPPLLAHPEAAFLWSELLRPYGFSYALARTAFARLPGSVGQQVLSGTHTLTFDRDQVLITPRLGTTDDEPVPLDIGVGHVELPVGTVHVTCLIRPDEPPAERPTDVWLDAEALHLPLRFRRWVPGDWFCPRGMGGHRKKLSDFLTDQKVPRPLKEQVWVLTSGEDVVWVLGLRADERFGIGPGTRRVVRLRFGDEPDGE